MAGNEAYAGTVGGVPFGVALPPQWVELPVGATDDLPHRSRREWAFATAQRVLAQERTGAVLDLSLLLSETTDSALANGVIWAAVWLPFPPAMTALAYAVDLGAGEIRTADKLADSFRRRTPPGSVGTPAVEVIRLPAGPAVQVVGASAAQDPQGRQITVASVRYFLFPDAVPVTVQVSVSEVSDDLTEPALRFQAARIAEGARVGTAGQRPGPPPAPRRRWWKR